jgi:uncharacterized membrane protein
VKNLVNLDALLSHSHWITINFNGKQVKLCARCFGTVIGFLATLLPLSLIEFKASLNLFYLCIALATPSIIDWLTQSWKLRDSKNSLRLITGFTNGSSVALFSILPLSFALKLKTILYILVFISAFGLTGKVLKQNRSLNNKKAY